MAKRNGDETLALFYEWVERMPELQTSHDTCMWLEYRGEPNPVTANRGTPLTLAELFCPSGLSVSDVAACFADIGQLSAFILKSGTRLERLHRMSCWEGDHFECVWFHESQEVAQLLATLLERPVYMYSKQRGEPAFKASFRAFPNREFSDHTEPSA